MTFLMMLSVILLSMVMILLSDLWQPLELASELESDLQDTVDWDKRQFVDCNAGKSQPGLFG